MASVSGVEIPAAGMPARGWVGYCKLVRRVEAGAGSNGYRKGAEWSEDIADEKLWAEHPRSSDQAYSLPPGVVGSPVVLTPGLYGAPAGLNAPTVATIGAGAVAGWLLGGVAISLMDWIGFEAMEGEHRDAQEWACRWNLAYRGLNSGLCDDLLNQPYQRAVVRLGVCAGNVAPQECTPVTVDSSVTWTISTTIREFTINPTLQPKRGGLRGGVSTITMPSLARVGEAPNTRVEDSPRPVRSPQAVENPPAALEQIQQAEQTPPIDGEDDAGSCGGTGWQKLLPWNIANAIGCVMTSVLKFLFIPKSVSFSALATELKAVFPLNILTGLATVVDSLIATWQGGMSNAAPCPVIGVGEVINTARRGPMMDYDFTPVALRLPAPSSSGCVGFMEAASPGTVADNKVGDLYGFQVMLRTMLLMVLYAGAAYRIAGAVTSAPEELEVGG